MNDILICIILIMILAIILTFKYKYKGKRGNKNKLINIGDLSSDIIISGNLIFFSGRIGRQKGKKKLIKGGLIPELNRIFSDFDELFSENGFEKKNIVKVTVLLKDMKKYDIMSNVYKSYFNNYKPALTCYAVSDLPNNAEVMVDMIVSV